MVLTSFCYTYQPQQSSLNKPMYKLNHFTFKCLNLPIDMFNYNLPYKGTLFYFYVESCLSPFLEPTSNKNEDNISWSSRKQWKPLMGFELRTDRLRVWYSTHCAMPRYKVTILCMKDISSSITIASINTVWTYKTLDEVWCFDVLHLFFISICVVFLLDELMDC